MNTTLAIAPTLRKPKANSSLASFAKMAFSTWGLGAIALCGILVAAYSPNRIAKQAGSAAALLSTGAAVATHQQKRKQQVEIHQLVSQHELREASLKTSLDVAMSEAETLSAQLAQMNEGLADFQIENVLFAGQIELINKERDQLINELYKTTLAEGKLAAALSEKTDMATQMLTELESEAASTFTQFTEKISSQTQLINELHQQIEALRHKNNVLINQQFENIGARNSTNHHLANYLAQN